MTIEQAIQNFYDYNGINGNDLASYLDPKIEKLYEKVQSWLNIISEEDRDLFLRMLSSYTYLTNSVAVRRYQSAVNLLNTKLCNNEIDMSEVLFVTVESSSPTKCGSDNVRTDLHRLCIDKIDAQQIIASTTQLCAEDIAIKSAVIFVDDIVSTGFTLWSTINNFLLKFPISRQKPLYYICIVPTQTGVMYVKKQTNTVGVSITPIYEKEWISKSVFKRQPSIFSELEKLEAENKIQKYEAIIDSYMKEEGKSYLFGFRESKQLVSFYYNTPNNTLCTFWRKTDTHVPLFRREKQPSPRLADLQKIKKRKDDCAYRMKKESEIGKGHYGT